MNPQDAAKQALIQASLADWRRLELAAQRLKLRLFWRVGLLLLDLTEQGGLGQRSHERLRFYDPATGQGVSLSLAPCLVADQAYVQLCEGLGWDSPDLGQTVVLVELFARLRPLGFQASRPALAWLLAKHQGAGLRLYCQRRRWRIKINQI